MNWKKALFATGTFFVSSFLIQGVLGFVVGGEYYQSISIMRQPPLFFLSLSSTILSGAAVAILYPLVHLRGGPSVRGVKFGLLTGMIVIPFVALDIPGRFMIPSEELWVVYQLILGMLHFTAAGFLIGIIYGNKDSENA